MEDLPLLDDYSVIATTLILVCTVGMVLYIYLSGIPGDFEHRTVDFGPHQRSMVKVSNPFVLELDKSTKDIKDDLRFSLSILCPCHVVVVWGPDIQALHDLILTPGRDVREKMMTDLQHTTNLEPLHWDVLRFDVAGEHNVALKCPEGVTSEALGEMPRSKYPVAIFMFTPGKYRKDGEGSDDADNRTEGTENNELNQDAEETKDNTIIGLFSIIHLKDAIVTKDSHVIAKYVKTAGVPIYSLQALFVNAGDQSQPETPRRDYVRSERYSNQFSGPSTSTDQSLRQRRTSNPSSTTENHVVCKDISANCEETDFCKKTLSESSSVNDRASQSTTCDPKYYDSVTNREQCISKGNVDDEDSMKEDKGPEDLDEHQRFDEVENQQHYKPTHEGSDNERVSQRPDCNISASDAFRCDISHNSQHLPDCVVCQSSPANCALLPCRHKCVCLRCLRLLDKCPMCRCAVESYFFASDEQGECDCEEEDDQLEELQRQTMAAHNENIFDGINQMVGFA